MALALIVLLFALHALGGRGATLALTGSLGPSALLGAGYVLAWLGAVALAPSLVLGAAFDVLLARLRRSPGGRKTRAAWGSTSARFAHSPPRGDSSR